MFYIIWEFIRFLLIMGFLMASCAAFAKAQGTPFTYQGKLTENASAANGSYQMQFALYDAAAGGSQIGGSAQFTAVQVTNGIFTVNLDFGANAFPGASRFLEISVYSGATNSFVALNPRQPVTSAPYAIRSRSSTNADTSENSNNLGGIPANQYVQTNDARLSDDRDPLPGSANYIQNTTSPQSSADFNISGNGTAGGTLSANAINSNSQYNIGNSRVLSVAGTNNTFTGFGAGGANNGANNSFFGRSAGFDNTTGAQNSFFGSFAGANNTTGAENAFFGSGAGDANTTGNLNSFFGRGAGGANTSGSSNTFVGRESGLLNTTGFFNAFVGRNAGGANTTGAQNTFFGGNAGFGNVSGNNNTYIGFNAGSPVGGNSNNTYIGNNTGNSSSSGSNNTLLGYNATISAGSGGFVVNSTAIGAGAVVTESNRIVLGTPAEDVVIPGDLSADYTTVRLIQINELGISGSQDICRNSSGIVSGCSSSRRYKTDITPFNSGLSLINRLRPVTFKWKSDGSPDLGLVAEEVAEIEPLLASYKDGRVEGVKYNRLGVVLLNAVKEQQAQIESLKRQIELLKRLVCAENPSAEICK